MLGDLKRYLKLQLSQQDASIAVAHIGANDWTRNPLDNWRNLEQAMASPINRTFVRNFRRWNLRSCIWNQHIV